MTLRLTNLRLFFSEFRHTFRTTGAIMPSGRALARSLAAPVSELSGPLRILEVGPGTGAVTTAIVEAMGPHDSLDLVELNERFVARIRERFAHEPKLAVVAKRTTIHHAEIEAVRFSEPFDVVVSGLPLNNFSADEVERILAKLIDLLKPAGVLSFFEYIAIRRVKRWVSRAGDRHRLSEISRHLTSLFSTHQSDHFAIWMNVPPAWSHHVRRREKPHNETAAASASTKRTM